MMAPVDAIDAYLNQLLHELRVRAPRARRILIEAEDHLREAARQGVAMGLAEDEATRQAIARFGSPRMVARRFAAEEGRLLPPSLLVQLCLALGLLAGIGLAAVGASGLLAAGMGGAFGKAFVAGDAPGVTYTPQRCADYLEYYPRAADCNAAAVAHHFDEVVQYRLTAGVLGLLALGGYALVRRRYRLLAGVRVLPESFISISGAAVFGVAALGLLGLSVPQLLFARIGSNGAGGLLSGGILSALLFAAFAASLLRTLRAQSVAAPE